jgi:predicted S18 family serine protease
MIQIIKTKANPDQIESMLQFYSDMVKIVVDIRQRILSGGGEMHADCELSLLENGSEQDDLWGANWYPADQSIAYEALINIRPRQGNRSIQIQDEGLRQKVKEITLQLLGEVK